MEAMIVVQLQ